MPQIGDNMRGAGFMVLAMLGFTLNDALMKLANIDIGLFQAIFLRGLLATTLMGVLTWRSGGFSSRRASFDRHLVLRTIGELAGSAFFLLTAYFCSIQAMRFGEVSFTSPFRYTALIWAGLLGYIAFGDIPDLAMIIGGFIVVCSGLYTLYRERKLAISRRLSIGPASP